MRRRTASKKRNWPTNKASDVPNPGRSWNPKTPPKCGLASASASAYKLFDPDDIVNAMDHMHDRSGDIAADAPENRKPDEGGL